MRNLTHILLLQLELNTNPPFLLERISYKMLSFDQHW